METPCTLSLSPVLGTKGQKLLQKQQKRAIDWRKKSGTVINASKTEAAYFALQELANPPEVNIDGNQIKLKQSMNVLGLTFDHALQWGLQVENILKEANRRTQAIGHIISILQQTSAYLLPMVCSLASFTTAGYPKNYYSASELHLTLVQEQPLDMKLKTFQQVYSTPKQMSSLPIKEVSMTRQ